MPKRYITRKRKRQKQRGGAGFGESIKNYFKRKNNIRYTPIKPEDIYTPENWLRELMVAVKLRDNPPEQFTEEDKQGVLQSIELCKSKFSTVRHNMDDPFIINVINFLNEMSNADFNHVLSFLKTVLGKNGFGYYEEKNMLNERIHKKNEKIRENYTKIFGIDYAKDAAGGGSSRRYTFDEDEDEYLDSKYNGKSRLKPTLSSNLPPPPPQYEKTGGGSVSRQDDVSIDEIDFSLKEDEEAKRQKSKAIRNSALRMPEIQSIVLSFSENHTHITLFDALKRFDKQTEVKPLTTDQYFELDRLREYFNKEIIVKQHYHSNNNDFLNAISYLKNPEFMEYLKLLKKYKFIKKEGKIHFLINVFGRNYYNAQQFFDKHAFIIEEFLEKDDVDFFISFINDLNKENWFQLGELRDTNRIFYNRYLNVFLRKLTQSGFFSPDNFRKIIIYLLEEDSIDETKKAQLEAEYAANNPEHESTYSFVPHVLVPREIKMDDEIIKKYKDKTPQKFYDIEVGREYFFIPRNFLTDYAGIVKITEKDNDKIVYYHITGLHKGKLTIHKEEYTDKENGDRMWWYKGAFYNLLKEGGGRRTRRNKKTKRRY